MIQLRQVACAALALALSMSSSARADPARAAQLYRAAEEAVAHDAFRAAAESFEGAFREDPHGASIYNAGVSWQAVGEPGRAADAFSFAVATTDLSATLRDDAVKRLALLERLLGQLDVRGPSVVKVSAAHADGVEAPARIHVTPGAVHLRALYPDGHSEERQLTVTGGQTIVIELPAVLAAPPPGPPTGAPGADARREPPPAARSPLTGRRIAGIALLGGGLVATGAAIVLGTKTLSAVDAFNATGRASQTDHDMAVSLRISTNVAWALAGACAVAGVILVVLPTRRPDATASLAVVAGPGAVQLVGSF